MTQFGWILDVFEDFSILAEKQRLKPRKSNSLMNFSSLDAQLDPLVTRLVEWNESGVKKPSVMMNAWDRTKFFHRDQEWHKLHLWALHSRASKILIRNQSLSMGPWQGDRALLGGLEFGFREILANGAGQKKLKNWNDISCSEFQTDYDALFTTSIL